MKKIYVDIETVVELIGKGNSKSVIAKTLGVSKTVIDRTVRENNLPYDKSQVKKSKHSEETKQKMSEVKKKWLKENPDKHSWSSKNKHFISQPCEKLKVKLTKKGITFCEEFKPLEDRAFSIDIAFPDKKIAIEVNGNQHYVSGTLNLKPYYQDRHDLIEAAGWSILELHYLEAFNEKTVELIESLLKRKESLGDFNYTDYFQKSLSQRKRNECICCGKQIQKKSGQCRKCYVQNRIGKHLKIQWPSPDEMQELLKSKPVTLLAKDLGVSDVAIHTFCKKNGLKKYTKSEIKKMVSALGIEPRTKG